VWPLNVGRMIYTFLYPVLYKLRNYIDAWENQPQQPMTNGSDDDGVVRAYVWWIVGVL